MLHKCSLETLMKWIFMALALSMVSLTIGARLHQSYSSKKIFAVGHGTQTKIFMENMQIGGSEKTVIDELGSYWRESGIDEIPDLVISAGEQTYKFKLNRKDIIISIVEEERFLLLVGMLGLLAAVELAVFISYVLTRPLRRLAWGCKQIAVGSPVKVPQNALSPYEFQELTDSFNYMASELEKWKEVQRQISRMDRLAALGEMISGLSHEIRNPLASMRIQMDLLRAEVEALARHSGFINETDSADAMEHIEVLETELDRLNNIVTQLLSFVRPREPMKTSVPLISLLLWSQSMLKPQAERYGVELFTKEIDENINVLADSEMLRQMLMNLALNAIQSMSASAKQGRKILLITVGCSDKADGPPKRGFIMVCDNGTGIPENIQHRIFDPFFTTRKEGTGLGLSIVQRIVEGHGASFSMKSSSAGTTFKIFLPLDGNCGSGGSASFCEGENLS